MRIRKVIALVTTLFVLCASTSVLADRLVVSYTDMEVPEAPTYFKTWMDYRAITNRSSDQYKFISEYGWCDGAGFMRCSAERDLRVEDDYYLVAMGSYYGRQIGSKYRVTLDSGRVIYVALGDLKDDRHTNSTHQYASMRDVLEFIVYTPQLIGDVKMMGSANVYMPLNGNVSRVEKMSFDWVADVVEETSDEDENTVITACAFDSSEQLRRNLFHDSRLFVPFNQTSDRS